MKQYPSHIGSVSLLEFCFLMYLRNFLTLSIAAVIFSLLILTPFINFLFSCVCFSEIVMYPPSPTVIYSFFFFNSSGLVNWEVGSQAAGATAAEKKIWAPRTEECGTDRWGRMKKVVWLGYLEGLGREEMDGCLRDEIALGSITAYILKNCDKQFRNVSDWWSPVGLQLCSIAILATQESQQFTV